MSCTQMNRNHVKINNGRDVEMEFDLRNGISIETTPTKSSASTLFVVVSSGRKNIRVPFDTPGGATAFRAPLEQMLRNMEKV